VKEETKLPHKITLELETEEVLAICRALLFSSHEAEKNAQKCEKFGLHDAEFWKKDAEVYRKAYKAVEAQREQEVRDDADRF